MSEPAKTDKIENDILRELSTIIQSYLDHAVSGLRVVAVDMKNRRLGYLCCVG